MTEEDVYHRSEVFLNSLGLSAGEREVVESVADRLLSAIEGYTVGLVLRSASEDPKRRVFLLQSAIAYTLNTIKDADEATTSHKEQLT